MNLHNTIIPFQDPSTRWNIRIEDGTVASLVPSEDTAGVSQPPNLLLPSLCHAHVHLDKPYLLTCNHPSSSGYPAYSDLTPQTGGFQEALSNTVEAKKRYTSEDLYLRGSQLLATSCLQGVSCLRAFVEVDHVTGLEPLKAAIQLKRDFAHVINVQICAFAQDPICSTEHGAENKQLLSTALEEFKDVIDVIGTTPYVEQDEEASRENIQWAIQTALRYSKHLDFHFEYNLNDGDTTEQFNFLIDALLANTWPTGSGAQTVVLGHATRLTQASHSELNLLAERIKNSNLPIHFVGLPTSDLYMMGRPAPQDHDAPLRSQRGTLNVATMIKEYGLNACISINNVGNAFTPYGSGDPLALASWGVGLYHAGSVDDAKLLYEAVSIRASKAIMCCSESVIESFKLEEGNACPRMLLVRNESSLQVCSTTTGTVMNVPARARLSIQDVVWDPPETKLRSIV